METWNDDDSNKNEGETNVKCNGTQGHTMLFFHDNLS